MNKKEDYQWDSLGDEETRNKEFPITFDWDGEIYHEIWSYKKLVQGLVDHYGEVYMTYSMRGDAKIEYSIKPEKETDCYIIVESYKLARHLLLAAQYKFIWDWFFCNEEKKGIPFGVRSKTDVERIFKNICYNAEDNLKRAKNYILNRAAPKMLNALIKVSEQKNVLPEEVLKLCIDAIDEATALSWIASEPDPEMEWEDCPRYQLARKTDL